MNLYSTPQVTFDPDTNEVIMSFLNSPEADDHDPISFQPTTRVEIRIPGAVATPLS